MASANHVNPIPVSEKLEKKLNLLKKLIDENKSEVIRVRDEMKQLIDIKSEKVLRELDSIWTEVNERKEKRRQEIEKDIQEINEHRKSMEKLFLKLNPTSIPKIDFAETFESVQKEMNIEIPFVKLTWRVSDLRDSIHRLCSCSKHIVKFSENTPIQLKWSSCTRGWGDNQLYTPFGVAINSVNNSIYVVDYNPYRIKIFSKEGNWIRTVTDGQMVKPENILIIKNSVFIQCNCCILKLKDSTFERESYKSYQHSIRGICTDNINVYVGVFREMKLIMLSLDLKEENRISLITNFHEQNKTIIRDISYAEGEFYVLLFDTEYPLQTFSREGTLLRCLVKKDLMNDAWYFCLDQQLNIIVSDTGASKVKIFSNEGKLLSQFGKKGTAAGDFTILHGIAVDNSGSIITVDWKNNHMLQAFSLF